MNAPQSRSAGEALERALQALRMLALAALIQCAPAWLHAQPELPALPTVADAAQAARFLAAPDPRERAGALVWLAEHGRESDAVAVAARLRDGHPLVRALAQNVIWSLWSRSGDAEIDAQLALGSRQMSGGALSDAIATFSEIIRRRPAFAEAWNKRATAYFLAGEFRKSIADCDEVMRRNPHHFGALAGYGQNYLQLEDFTLALEYFRRALEVNPDMQGVQQNIRGLEHRLEQERRRST